MANPSRLDTDELTNSTEQEAPKPRPTALKPMLIFFLFIVLIVVLGKIKM